MRPTPNSRRKNYVIRRMPETQAFSVHAPQWKPPSGALGGLVTRARARAHAEQKDESAWHARALSAPAATSLAAALRGDTVSVIAEVKRKSPSRGSIKLELDAGARALAYAEGGAAAISVLTEPEHFGGDMADLTAVVAAVAVPVIRKDFIVAPVQLYHARALGASACLLIARALPPRELEQLYGVACEIGLEAVVEVRDEEELNLALQMGARIIGVNNRNLESLVIESGTAERLVRLVPRTVVAVAESGMTTAADVARAAQAGADAILMGTALSSSDDAAAAVRSLINIAVERDDRPD